MNNTPETDGAEIIFSPLKGDAWVPASISRKLERERDEAREQNAKLRDIAERAIKSLINPPALSIFPTLAIHNEEQGKQLRAELDQLKEEAK